MSGLYEATQLMYEVERPAIHIPMASCESPCYCISCVGWTLFIYVFAAAPLLVAVVCGMDERLKGFVWYRLTITLYWFVLQISFQLLTNLTFKMLHLNMLNEVNNPHYVTCNRDKYLCPMSIDLLMFLLIHWTWRELYRNDINDTYWRFITI